MSYAMSAALQASVFQRLTGDAALSSLVGSAIYDEVPSGALPGLYVAIGNETVRDNSDCSNLGARHDLRLSVISEDAGYQRAKQVAGAISDALIHAPLTLTRGRVISMQFLRAVARRADNSAQRRIDLTFRARVEDD